MNLGFCTPFFVCDGWMDGLHLVCKSSWTPIPSAPPAGGGTWYTWPPRHYYQRRMDDSCPLQVLALCTSTSERTLREAGFVGQSTVFVYDNEATYSASISSFHRMSRWIINFGMLLSVTQWWSPLCPLANPFCGFCCLGSCPFVCLVCCFSWRNANLAGGFAGRLGCVSCVLFGVIWFACIYGPSESLYKCHLDSLCSCKDRATVRHRPYPRKKKIRHPRIPRQTRGWRPRCTTAIGCRWQPKCALKRRSVGNFPQYLWGSEDPNSQKLSETVGGGSIRCWSRVILKTVRLAERQRVRTKRRTKRGIETS